MLSSYYRLHTITRLTHDYRLSHDYLKVKVLKTQKRLGGNNPSRRFEFLAKRNRVKASAEHLAIRQFLTAWGAKKNPTLTDTIVSKLEWDYGRSGEI